MSLTATNQVDTNKYELEIQVDKDRFEEAVGKAYRKNVKNMQIPGFRKGKAPRKMIEKLYGEGVFYEDAVNSLYPVALREAVEESGLEIVSTPEVEVTEVGKENGVTMKATFFVKPQVEIKKYKGIKVEKPARVITDDDVDGEISKLQQRNARIVPVEGREAKLEDVANIDFEGFLDGTAFEGGKGEGFDLTLGSGQFIPGFEDQIVGHKPGDEFDVTVTFPEDYQAEELKGKEAVFKVKLNELKEKELPEVDDEFAKDVSEFENVADLRADLKNKLEERAKNESEEKVETQLIDALIAALKGDIPEVMYENRVDDMLRDFENRLRMQGINMDMYMQYTGLTPDAMRKTYREQAESQVKLRLALEKIAAVENIEVSDEELEAEYQKWADNYKMELERIKQLLTEKDLKADIAVQKAMDLVKDSAKITEVEA